MAGTDARETGDRHHFLGRLRDRLSGGVPENPIRPVVALDDGTPEIAYASDLTDLEARFHLALEAVAGTVRRVGADQQSIHQLVADVCDAERVKRAIVSRDPECAGLPELLAELGVEVVPLGDENVAATADLGITGAAYGIALTGSLVVDSTRAGTRLASLLPPVHLALLPIVRLLPTPGDLFRRLPDTLPDGLPSNLVLITGPSRSADIELQITLGVHGPRALCVGLLGAD